MDIQSLPRITDKQPCPPGIYMGSCDPNSSPYTYKANTLTTEPYPQTYSLLLIASLNSPSGSHHCLYSLGLFRILINDSPFTYVL